MTETELENGAADVAASDLQPSLLAWAMRFLPHYIMRDYSAMHRWLGEQLDAIHKGSGARINVLGPRGGAKSTIVTLAYVLRTAVEGREPYIWIISDSNAQAARHLENVKVELIDNEDLAGAYPGATGKGKTWRKDSIVLKSGIAVEAYGTGQPIRGRRFRAARPSLIVCDDLEREEHAYSGKRRDKSRRWFFSTLAKAGTKGTNMVHIATALHRETLGLHLTRAGTWTSRVFRAIERWPNDMALWEAWEEILSDATNPNAKADARAFFEAHRARLEEGAELLWPEEEDLYTLMSSRAEGGRAAFEREKQCAPVSEETAEFPESYFGDHIWFDEWPRDMHIKTMALDPSKGGTDRCGDLSAYVMFGAAANGLIYLEADIDWRQTPDMVEVGVALYRQFRPHGFAIETNLFQALLARMFDEEFKRQGMLVPAIHPIDNRVNKRVRIRSLSSYLARRKMRFKAKSPSTRLLVEQFKDFPNGEHDDGPDAVEMALKLAEDLIYRRTFHDGFGDRLPLTTR